MNVIKGRGVAQQMGKKVDSKFDKHTKNQLFISKRMKLLHGAQN